MRAASGNLLCQDDALSAGEGDHVDPGSKMALRVRSGRRSQKFIARDTERFHAIPAGYPHIDEPLTTGLLSPCSTPGHGGSA
jgi:hypothetical protein